MHNTNEELLYKECLKEVNDYFECERTQGRTDCSPAKACNVGVMLPYMSYTPKTLKEIMQNKEKTE